MFLPKGPTAVGVVNNPGSISLDGVDRDNLVVQIATSPGIAGTVSMGPVSITVFGGVEYFRVPTSATAINISTFAQSGQVSAALGEDF